MLTPTLLVIALLGAGLQRLGTDPDDNKLGTATCERQENGKRRILQCWEKITRPDARKQCYDGLRGDRLHWQSPGPTCFAILNGDVPWP